MSLASLVFPSGTQAFLQTAAPYFAVAAFVLTLLAIVFVILLSRRLDRLSLGKSGSLEDTIGVLSEHMKDMQNFRSELEVYLKHAESRLRTSVRGIGVVRYNPFANDGSSGGNQSFAIAFLDESLSGVVFSALYARDRVGVYAKPLTQGASTFTLSDEERQAVEKAKQSLNDRKRGESK